MPEHHLPYDMSTVDFETPARSRFVPGYGYLEGFGTTVGGGYTTDWAPGARYWHLDASYAGQVQYVNIGDKTAADWQRVSGPRMQFETFGRDEIFWGDDFQSVQTYTSVDDGGTGAAAIGTNKLYSVATAAADNDYHFIYQAACPVDLLIETTEFAYEIRLKVTEANTDDSNWVAGLVIAADVASTLLADDGGGPPADYDGMIFWKVDGTMEINCEYSHSTGQFGTQSLATFASATWYTLKFVYDGSTITPYVNGTAGTAFDPLVAVSAHMCPVFGVKAGGANAETMLVDYHKTWFKYTGAGNPRTGI